MARYKVNQGETRTDPIALASGDTLYIDTGGSVLQSGSTTAVTLAGTGASVRNFGTVQTAGSGFAISGTLSGTLDVSIRNEAGGTITSAAGGIRLTSAAGTTGEVYLFNAGTIQGGSTRAVELNNLRAETIRIENAAGGLITNAGSADVVRPGNDGEAAIFIDNAGTIRAGVVAGATSGGDAIDLQPVDGGIAATVINRASGIIEGGKHGVTGANDATITNAEGGQIIGRNGSGINFDTESADGDTYVTVINDGLISGGYDGFGDGDGDGIDVDYLVDVSNAGRIEGVGADMVENFADGIAAGGGIIRNLASGTISGETNGILIDDGDRNGAYAETRLNNAGLIEGRSGTAVRFIGEFDDRIVNSGAIVGSVAIDAGGGDDRITNTGTIAGTVLLGDGNDLFRSGLDAFAGTIDGGAGDDRISTTGNWETLIGGLGRDTLAGGVGDDTFLYHDVSESNRANGVDRITDYQTGDRIDLTAIDADTSMDGDQAFQLIGTAVFSGQAGELRIAMNTGNNVLMGDVDGDRVADFLVTFEGTTVPADILAGVLA